MELLGAYKNGNYTVRIYSDGTKIRENDLDFFAPDFPESMDIKITNSCDMMCKFCHEASTPNGQHGDILHMDFLNTLHPYTELAIGGGNPLSHPDLVPFLERLKELKVIPSITVNQKHFLENIPLLRNLSEQRLIYGLGVSYTGSNGLIGKLRSELKSFPNAVIHVINGIVSVDELSQFAWNDLKILILGYKDFRRGVSHHERAKKRIADNQDDLYINLQKIISDKWFEVVSFDNLAIEQLNVRRLMSEEDWNRFYMGNDGNFTMYVDAVNREYAVCSVSEKRYPLSDNIVDMFHTIRTN